MTNPLQTPLSASRQSSHLIPGLITWALGSLVIFYIAPQLDLANLAMLLVLTSAIAATLLPALASLILGVVAILLFNWLVVPPRGSFLVNLQQHTVLLLAMLVVNSLIALLMASLRSQSRRAQRHAEDAEMLRSWGDKLRDSGEPLAHLADLQQALMQLSHARVVVFACDNELPKTISLGSGILLGEVSSEQADALCYATQYGQALGPYTGRFPALADCYFPLRGRSHSFGAVLIAYQYESEMPLRVQVQALCDQMGIALERRWMVARERTAREQAQAQALRNTLLAAISHDYRTPLAIIMGAASAIERQDERLSPAQRQEFARSIFNEADRLTRLTNNILQLARLETLAEPGSALNCDWQSAEDIVGAVMHRLRQQGAQKQVHSRVEKNLPLLWCDPLLISQLLENLVDNAVKYTPLNTPIEIIARREGEAIVLAVRDYGEGVDPAIQEHIFTSFYRGKATLNNAVRPGGGIGLALCRAIAIAHSGQLRLQSSAAGASFECLLTIRPQPLQPQAENEEGDGGGNGDENRPENRPENREMSE